MGSSFDVSMPFPPSSCTKSPDSAQPGRDLCGKQDVDESAQDQLMHTMKIEHLWPQQQPDPRGKKAFIDKTQN